MDRCAFGMRVTTMRQARSMTTRRLARTIGVSEATMEKIERGQCVTSVETLVKLCNVLQISPIFLLKHSLIELPLFPSPPPKAKGGKKKG